MDWFSIFGMLFQGLPGWIALGFGTAGLTAAGYYTARRRYKNVRSTTYAYQGGEKGFETLNARDIDDKFASFERYDNQVKGLIEEFNRSKGGARVAVAAHILKVADRMLEECDELLRDNIAFRTKQAHRQFLDQVDSRRAGAIQLRKEALRVQQQERPKAASG